MKLFHSYHLLAAFVIVIFLSGCGKRMNNRVTLWRNDKIPYGTFYAFNNLHYFFKNAGIETSNASPETFPANETGTAYLIIGRTVEPSEEELRALLSHIYSGNQVFISAINIGDNLLDSLRLTATGFESMNMDGDMRVSVLDPLNFDSLSFAYPGFHLQNHFTKLDTGITNILGKDVDGRANFVRISFQGGGAVLIHLAPAAFTNFFLLHKTNKRYFDLAMSSITDTVRKVRWDDYFRHHRNGKNTSERSTFSKLKEILGNEVLRWAFWLTLLLFAIIYLFESKRKQRVVPTMKTLNNTSLDFVKTIGRLYFQRKDNKNLASKMSTHFFGHIRSRYNLSTSQPAEELSKKLAFKSGYPEDKISDILSQSKKLEEPGQVTDEQLLAFNQKLDNFYKQT